MQYSIWFRHAQESMVHVLPKIRSWASSFALACGLLPEPQVEQVPRSLSLHTSQFIPQAPVGIETPPFQVPKYQTD
jgi:hypothetical protein